MTIDGKNDLACELQVSACKKKVVTVEPLRAFPVLRDLMVDQTDFFARYESVKPWLICSKQAPTAGTPAVARGPQADRWDVGASCAARARLRVRSTEQPAVPRTGRVAQGLSYIFDTRTRAQERLDMLTTNTASGDVIQSSTGEACPRG
jgi:succinate dehydrogenase/fumarate reductase-like Fe-S protein